MIREVAAIAATTDVHSAFDNANPMLSGLHEARARALIVDCGDYFEGSRFYRLGRGAIERQVLTSLYDVIAPGNHGWQHYLEPDIRALTVCANVVDQQGVPVFRPLHRAVVGGLRVLVTAVIGEQAFATVPPLHRTGQRATDPVNALRDLLLRHHHRADAWVLLSHSGFEADLRIAEECPFLDVIFAGHCHSDRYGPAQVGRTVVVKGHELGVGYAWAEPASTGWTAHAARFTDTPTSPTALAPITDMIDSWRRHLAAPLRPVLPRWQNSTPCRATILQLVAEHLHDKLRVPVLLNETALRSTKLGTTLRVGDLLAVEPFGNQLVHAKIPHRYIDRPEGLVTHLTQHCGPTTTVPRPLSAGTTHVLTTDYLATTFLDRYAHDAGFGLGESVLRVLTTDDERNRR
ncbi:metallophosphoesterase [Kitasatospora misakiensis]|uniref:Metallophosphoesterase n=1 Tax=Kitasatospora misakiensis TaxID=67330 RepID=A0ABW0X618_9ACTN